MKVQPLAAQLALLLVRPGSGYRRQLAAAGRAFESVGGEGARQFGEFVRRVSDLSLDEFKELYDETFPHGCPLDVAALTQPATTPSLPSEAREALDIAILPSATTFRAGDVLRLDVQGHWFFRKNPLFGSLPAAYERSDPARVVLHVGGEHGAYLLVPIVA